MESPRLLLSPCRCLTPRLLVLLLLCVLPAHSLFADAFSERRARVGLNLFRTFVGADMEIEKRVNQQGGLTIVLLYVDHNREARQYLPQLQQTLPDVHGLSVRIELLSLAQLQQRSGSPAAVFVAEKLSDRERTELVTYSVSRRIAVFSPFEGDVEGGILGGLSVAASVRPLVNMKTLHDSQVRLKHFYLSVARHYDE